MENKDVCSPSREWKGHRPGDSSLHTSSVPKDTALPPKPCVRNIGRNLANQFLKMTKEPTFAGAKPLNRHVDLTCMQMATMQMKLDGFISHRGTGAKLHETPPPTRQGG